MTHERIPNGEPVYGPEHDHSLPDATDIPVYDDPAESDAPPMDEED
jgi:hypothetical protein